MTLDDWLREYDKDKEKEIAQMFDSNREPMFNYLEFFDTQDEKMSEGMNKKSIFIFKKNSCSLWCHISSKKSDKLKFMKDLIYSNTKKKHWLRQENRGECGQSFSFKNVLSHGF